MKRLLLFLLLLPTLLVLPLSAQQSVTQTLADQAQAALTRGDEAEACRLYTEVLKRQSDHRQAHIFLGNYYYLKAEKERQKLESDYRRLTSPTRMQYAYYRNQFEALLKGDYTTAKEHLQQVLRLFPSTEAAATLKKIEALEQAKR